MKTLIEQLPHDKIKINWNKNPIRMVDFLSFLTIDVVKSTNHLGSDNGWTQYRNDSINLIIGGGIVRVENENVNFLDTIQYGKKLQNRFNNYVNAFYLLDIMNDNGRKFFCEYYKPEIDLIIKNKSDQVNDLKERIILEKEYLDRLTNEYKSLTA